MALILPEGLLESTCVWLGESLGPQLTLIHSIKWNVEIERVLSLSNGLSNSSHLKENLTPVLTSTCSEFPNSVHILKIWLFISLSSLFSNVLSYLLLTTEQTMRICSQYLSCTVESEANNTSIARATLYSPLSNNKLPSLVDQPS
jgi:hypothetical protein